MLSPECIDANTLMLALDKLPGTDSDTPVIFLGCSIVSVEESSQVLWEVKLLFSLVIYRIIARRL